MARTILEPEFLNYGKAMSLKGEPFMEGLEPVVVPWLLFRGRHHFNAMNYNSRSKPFSNGYFKEGTIRYKSGSVSLPISERMLLFESSEFAKGMMPTRYARIQHVVVSPLEELTDDEIMKDGFDSREDMLWQMTEMKDRYYKDLKPSSKVSYFAFGGFGPFSGDRGSAINLYPLKQQGDYWEQLKQKDKTGWTKRIKI